MRWLLLTLGRAACGGTTAGNDGGTDASLVDAKNEAAAMDAGPDLESDDANVGCPRDLPAGFTPTWIPPSAPTDACTATQITELYDACNGPKQSASACETFLSDPSNASCQACVESPIAAATYGPTIAWHGGASLDANIGGCMALLDGDLGGSGCGAKFEAWEPCEIAACSYCPAGTYESCAGPAD